MIMMCSNKVGEELVIDSNNLYDYIGNIPEHTKISQKDLVTIFKSVFFLECCNEKGNAE